jgi:hypothetical protein
MAQESNDLQEKRQKALQKLRARHGQERSPKVNAQQVKTEEMQLLLKGFKSQRQQQNTEAFIETETLVEDEIDRSERSDLVQDQDETDVLMSSRGETDPGLIPVLVEDDATATPELPKILRVRRKVIQQDQQIAEAFQKLRQILQARRRKAQQDSASGVQEEALTRLSARERQQLVSDLLSSQFLDNAFQWLSSAKTGPELSSSSLEEVEAIYQQSRYRYRVLKAMLDESEKELDTIELHLRMMRQLTSDRPSA